MVDLLVDPEICVGIRLEKVIPSCLVDNLDP